MIQFSKNLLHISCYNLPNSRSSLTLKTLSRESGIPFSTLRDWYYVPKNQNSPSKFSNSKVNQPNLTAEPTSDLPSGGVVD